MKIKIKNSINKIITYNYKQVVKSLIVFVKNLLSEIIFILF